jgi:REP element-mobilizing transposase RayT
MRRHVPLPWRRAQWHRERPEISGLTPVHVAIRVRDGTTKLRFKRAFRVVRTALAAVCDKLRFRLVDYSVQNNHLHLIAEADDKFALSRAMRSLSIRIAKRINQLMGERGVRIRDRYFMSVLKSPLDVNMARKYVINNHRRHAAQFGRRLAPGFIDPCSSALWFDGWSDPPEPVDDPCPDLPPGIVAPRSDALRFSWKMYGLLDPSYVPGPFEDRRKVA